MACIFNSPRDFGLALTGNKLPLEEVYCVNQLSVPVTNI